MEKELLETIEEFIEGKDGCIIISNQFIEGKDGKGSQLKIVVDGVWNKDIMSIIFTPEFLLSVKESAEGVSMGPGPKDVQ